MSDKSKPPTCIDKAIDGAKEHGLSGLGAGGISGAGAGFVAGGPVVAAVAGLGGAALGGLVLGVAGAKMEYDHCKNLEDVAQTKLQADLPKVASVDNKISRKP